MSERRSSADLGAQAEAALSAFPYPERDWEQAARAVEAKLTGLSRTSTDALLLAAPLPQEPGEPVAFGATTTPLDNSGVRPQSLAEMARRSVEQKRAAERELGRANLALAAQARVSETRASVEREAVSAVRASDAPAPPPSVRPALGIPGPKSAPGMTWPQIGLTVGALALAAAVFLWLRRPEPQASGVATLGAVPTQADSPAPVSARPGAGADRPGMGNLPAGVDPNTLSPEGAAQAANSKPVKTASAAPSAGSSPTASASAAGLKPDAIVLEDEQPSTAAVPTAAAAAPKAQKLEKALPPDPALRPADSVVGAMPVKPSSGAVQAALGSVMSGARHCVAGDEAASSAVVVFASDGRVQSVSVRGPAAGKPSGACIEAQLSRARVQPFAAATFSVNTTVRPD